MFFSNNNQNNKKKSSRNKKEELGRQTLEKLNKSEGKSTKGRTSKTTSATKPTRNVKVTRSNKPKGSNSRGKTNKSEFAKMTEQKRRSSNKLWAWILSVLLCIGVSLGGYAVWRSDFVQMRYVYMWEYQQDIVTYAQKNNMDPFLVAAIIKNESGFNPKAVSNVGAVGLMQIMPETGRWIATQMGLKKYEDGDLYKTQTNIRMGCWYLGELDAEFKHNLTLIMIAYNAGRGKTHQWMEANGWSYDFNEAKKIPYPDTREYVIKVLEDRDKYYLLYRDKLGVK